MRRWPMSPFSSSSIALMRRTFPTALAAAFAVGLSLASSEVQAQAAASLSEPGTDIQAVGYAPVPAGSVFEVQADDELSQEALEQVRTELANHGYAAQEQASLVMQVDSDLVRGQRQDDPL